MIKKAARFGIKEGRIASVRSAPPAPCRKGPSSHWVRCRRGLDNAGSTSASVPGTVVLPDKPSMAAPNSTRRSLWRPNAERNIRLAGNSTAPQQASADDLLVAHHRTGRGSRGDTSKPARLCGHQGRTGIHRLKSHTLALRPPPAQTAPALPYRMPTALRPPLHNGMHRMVGGGAKVDHAICR